MYSGSAFFVARETTPRAVGAALLYRSRGRSVMRARTIETRRVSIGPLLRLFSLPTSRTLNIHSAAAGYCYCNEGGGRGGTCNQRGVVILFDDRESMRAREVNA